MLVVDSDVLGFFQRARQLASLEALGRLPIVVTDSVWAELIDGARQAGSGSHADEMETCLKVIAGSPIVVEAGSEEGRAAAYFLRPPSPVGQGEASVVAYCSTNPGATAILLDRRAMMLGVEELAGRVLSVHGFLKRLVIAHQLSTDAAESVSQKIRSRQGDIRQPYWWSSFLVEQRVAT